MSECFWTDLVSVAEDCDGLPEEVYAVSINGWGLQYAFAGDGAGTWTPDDPLPHDITLEIVDDESAFAAAVVSFTIEVIDTQFGAPGSEGPVTGPGFSYSIAGDQLSITGLIYGGLSSPGQSEWTLTDTVRVTAQSAVGEVVSDIEIFFSNDSF